MALKCGFDGRIDSMDDRAEMAAAYQRRALALAAMLSEWTEDEETKAILTKIMRAYEQMAEVLMAQSVDA